MLKKTISYETFDGDKITEDFYFHLSRSEILEFEYSLDGGLEGTVARFAKSDDVGGMYALFKDLILKSYGVKSDDGKRFVKVVDNQRLSDLFVETNAFEELITEVTTNADAAVAFFNGIVPADVAAAAAEEAKKTEAQNKTAEALGIPQAKD